MSTPPPPPGHEPAPGSVPGPPPPPSTPPPPPPPGAPAQPYPGAAQPPPGYVAYGTPVHTRSTLQNTRGLRIATVVLIWVATLGTALQLLTMYNRRSVWNDPSSSFSDLVDADDTVAGAFVFYAVAAIATVIVLSIWTLRSVRNSQTLGAQRVRPGLACGGWYIPLGNVFVPFIQIRRATGALGAKTTGSVIWQVGWGAMVIGGGIVNTAFNESNVFDPDSVTQDLSTQVVGATITFVAAVVAAIGATMATKSLDEAVEARVGV